MTNEQEVDIVAARAKRDAMDATQWWKPKAGEGRKWGENYLRLMPPHPNMERVPYLDIPLHFGVGPGNVTVPCPRRKSGLPCLLCEMSQALLNAGKEQEGQQLRSKFYGYLNVVPLKEDGTPAGDPPSIRVLSTPKTVIDLILDILEGPHPDLFSLETGRNISLRRRGTGKTDTKYSIVVAPEPSEFNYPELLEGLNDLTTISPYIESEQMAALVEGSARADPFGEPPSARGPVTGPVLPARTMPAPPEDDGEEVTERREADPSVAAAEPPDLKDAQQALRESLKTGQDGS
jgi:hypothetical protein